MEREKRMGWYKLRITKRETLSVDDEAEHDDGDDHRLSQC